MRFKPRDTKSIEGNTQAAHGAVFRRPTCIPDNGSERTLQLSRSFLFFTCGVLRLSQRSWWWRHIDRDALTSSNEIGTLFQCEVSSPRSRDGGLGWQCKPPCVCSRSEFFVIAVVRVLAHRKPLIVPMKSIRCFSAKCSSPAPLQE